MIGNSSTLTISYPLTEAGSTFSDFAGVVTAYASYDLNDVLKIPSGASGTVYRQGPDEADFCGTISSRMMPG